MRNLASLFIAFRLYLFAVPYTVFGTGIAMNQAVMVANGGKFPVLLNDVEAVDFGFKENGYADSKHYRMTNETRLNWLADWINLRMSILSPGDLFILLGDWLGRFSLVIWSVLLMGDVMRVRQTNQARLKWTEFHCKN